MIRQRAAEILRAGCVIIDLETTGFVSPTVEIVEIAVIDQTAKVLLHTLVKPQRAIPIGASLVHGLYAEHLEDAPPFEQVYDQLKAVLSDRWAIAYNHTFEEGILKSVCAQHGQAPLRVNWFCAMRGYQSFRGLHHFTKLTEACQSEGVKIENAHRALGDCLMTLKLLEKIAGDFLINDSV
ncbi:MAG: 3'-5' exonuclease [Anaerolineae bacterium]|jgi:DNA polymerase-3 subunit epsilon|nr:3'-5' exonuclease [Anaerolineae bacterium]